MASINFLPLTNPTKDSTLFIFNILSLSPPTSNPILLLLPLAAAVLIATLLSWSFSSSGPAWPTSLSHLGPTPIPGPRGLPFVGSLPSLSSLPHRTLSSLSQLYSSSGGRHLIAVSLASTPAVISSDPSLSRELLSHPFLTNRPLKLSARELLFSRALGFAPAGPYWSLLRRISSAHLFSPRSIVAHATARASDARTLISRIAAAQKLHGYVALRPHVQATALNNITGAVFGRRYDHGPEGTELRDMVREGFELLGGFNFADYVPWLGFLDRQRVGRRCGELVARVKSFVGGIIEEHKDDNKEGEDDNGRDFVDVLLSLRGEEKLDDEDMIAVLWVISFLKQLMIINKCDK